MRKVINIIDTLNKDELEILKENIDIRLTHLMEKNKPTYFESDILPKYVQNFRVTGMGYYTNLNEDDDIYSYTYVDQEFDIMINNETTMNISAKRLKKNDYNFHEDNISVTFRNKKMIVLDRIGLNQYHIDDSILKILDFIKLERNEKYIFLLKIIINNFMNEFYENAINNFGDSRDDKFKKIEYDKDEDYFYITHENKKKKITPKNILIDICDISEL